MLLANEKAARDYVTKRSSASAMRNLETFVAELSRANDQQNLVARGSLQTIWLRHIADSGQLLDHVPRETGVWLDLGTGAGMPGLLLAIIDDDRQYVLVEARKLRVQWLQHMIEKLRLGNCTVVSGDIRRIDAFAADFVSARAFAPLPRLIEVSARFSTNATRWVLPKGKSVTQELETVPICIREKFHVKPSVTDADAGILVATGRLLENAP